MAASELNYATGPTSEMNYDHMPESAFKADVLNGEGL